VAMCVRRPVPPTVRDAAARRTRAVLVPWLFWSAAYIPFLLWREWRHGRPPLAVFEPTMLLYGPVIHLWFLPFILAANLTAVFLARRTLRLPIRRVIWASATIGALTLLACAYVRLRMPPVAPFGQWVFSIACIPLGMALGRAISLDAPRWKTLIPIGMAAVIVLAVSALSSTGATLEWGLLKRYGLALLLIGGASVWAGQTDGITQMLVRNSFGIYLVHPMVLMVAGEYSLAVPSVLVETLLVWFASLLFVFFLRRTPLARLI